MEMKVHKEPNGVGSAKVPMAVEVRNSEISTFYRTGRGVINVFEGPYNRDAIRRREVMPAETMSALEFRRRHPEAYAMMFP